MTFVDIHTHNPQPDNIIALRSFRFSVDSIPNVPTHPFSIGIHPWDASTPVNWENFESLAIQSDAIGECGLDKCCNVDFNLQLNVFYRQIEIAQRLQKPLIIHCVKAYGAILEAHKHFPHHHNWLIHGCYASPEWISSIARDGNIFFSIGQAQMNFKNFHKVLAAIPTNRLLAETDDSLSNISNIYRSINADVESLYNNYLHFFRS